MYLKKNFTIFILISIISILNRGLLADIEKRYTIFSDSQTHNEKGIFEANGNVRINGENNFAASSDKLIYEKTKSKLSLIGNVKVENYQLNNILVENISSDELILYTDKDELQINSNNGNKVKTNLRI